MVCYRESGLLMWKIEETELELSVMALPSSIPTILGDRNSKHRLQSLAAQAMAFELFGDEVAHLPSGRPYLKNNDMKISISNTGDYVALSYGTNRTGVDIEMKDRNAERVIGRVSVPEELCRACNLYPSNGPILLWCLKEACYKMVENQPEGLDLERQILISGYAPSNTALMCSPEGTFAMRYFEMGPLLVVRSL